MKPEANSGEGRSALYLRADELKPAHWEALRGREPEEAAQAAGARWDGEAFQLDVLGRTLRVDPRGGRVLFADDPEEEAGFERALVAVTCLGGALEAPLKGEWVSFRELPGGDAFFRGPHSVATIRLERAFGSRPEILRAAGRRLGGAEVSGADVAVELPALPRVPLRALVWGETLEFSARASLLTDGRAHLQLPLATLWALSNVAISDLVKAAQRGA